jgi:hypothetical protein
MGVFKLPLRNDQPSFDFTVSLDGVAYTFLFAYSTREDCWYFSLFTQDEEPIWLSIRVVVNWPLGFRSRSALRPPGLFMAFDTAETGTDPGLSDLGARVILLYFDAVSVERIATL